MLGRLLSAPWVAIGALLLFGVSLQFAFGYAAGDPAEKPGIYSLPTASEDYAGKILHWQQTTLFSDGVSPDAANGRVIHGDVWVRFTEAGKPDALRGIFAYEDGEFYQEYLYVGQTETIRRSGVPGPNGESPACWTVTELAPDVFAAWVDPGQPLYITNAEEMSAQGWLYQGSGPRPDHEFQTSPHAPDWVLPLAGQIDTWTSEETAGELTKIRSMGVNQETGRVETESHVIKDSGGAVVRNDLRVRGEVEVFGPNTAPPGMFALDKVLEPCS